MKEILPGSGISLTDFVTLSTYFLMTMTAFFTLRERRHRWINGLFLLVFGVAWLVVVASDRPLGAKVFATLLLISISTVEVLFAKRRRADSRRPL